MENDNEVVQPEVEQESEPEQTEETPFEEPESEVVDSELQQKLEKEIEARRQLTARATKAEAEKKALEARLNKLTQSGTDKSLDVSEYIDISANLDGLDQREKEKLAKEHKLTGSALKEIRESEDFKLWQSAYRDKVEKEKSLKPSGTQSETSKVKSFMDRLSEAKTLAEKEKLLTEQGLWKPPSSRSNVIRLSN